MNRPAAWLRLVLAVLMFAGSSLAATAKKYVLKVDPQALAVAQAAFAAMGGAQAVTSYQDSQASGTVALYPSGSPISYPITLKSKGLRKTRVELQMPKGTNLRIANQGQGVIVRPDGTVKNLDSNNTFYEHVNHIPLLSLLAEYTTGTVNLLYDGVQKIHDQSEDVIEIDFVPTTDQVAGQTFASMSKTLFYVNQSTSLVDKIQSTPLYEGDNTKTCTEEIYLANYQSVNGLLVPFRQTVLVDGTLESDMTLTSIAFNVGLSDTEFALPQGR